MKCQQVCVHRYPSVVKKAFYAARCARQKQMRDERGSSATQGGNLNDNKSFQHFLLQLLRGTFELRDLVVFVESQ